MALSVKDFEFLTIVENFQTCSFNPPPHGFPKFGVTTTVEVVMQLLWDNGLSAEKFENMLHARKDEKYSNISYHIS